MSEILKEYAESPSSGDIGDLSGAPQVRRLAWLLGLHQDDGSLDLEKAREIVRLLQRLDYLC